jgi:SAM-dependent methyltransferase
MKCPYCDNEKISKKIPVYSSILKKEVRYHKCADCFSVYQFPIPDDDAIKLYYESYYEIKQKMNPGYLDERHLAGFFNERDMTLKEIGFDLDRVRVGNNVELGCANGHFLRYLARHKAVDITGIDISEKLLSEIKMENVKLISGDLSCIKDNSVDNLFMFNILEHMTDVNRTMSYLKAILKESGTVIIEVPLSGIVSNLFGKNWRFFMPDEHLCIPSFLGLKKLFSKHGFKMAGYVRFGSGLTKGMTFSPIKSFFDFFVKLIKIGDRGAFLMVKK